MRSLAASRGVFVALLVLYVAVGIWTTRKVSATGDEPLYFMATDALVHGEGLELTKRWEVLAGASYDPADPISPEEFLRSTAPSRARAGNYPLHDLALSLIIAPPLALGGRALVVVFIAVAMAAAVALGHRSARTLGSGPAVALGASLSVGLAAPALTYSGQVFADALAPLAFALALGGLVRALPRGAVGAGAALLVLLHLRFWPLALTVIALELVLRRPSWRAAGLLLAPLGVAVVGLSLVDLVVYGVPLPHAGFLLFFTDRQDAHLAAYTRAPGEGLVGIFIDRSFGLLSAAPISALVFAGAGRLLRDGRMALLVALPLPYLLVVSALDWTGGFNPQARYLVVLAPLFCVLIARALEWRAARLVAVALGSWTIGQSSVYAAAPWLRYDFYAAPPLADRAWSHLGGLTPSAVFPLFGTDGATRALAGVWVLALLLLLGAGWLRVPRRAVTPVS